MEESKRLLSHACDCGLPRQGFGDVDPSGFLCQLLVSGFQVTTSITTLCSPVPLFSDIYVKYSKEKKKNPHWAWFNNAGDDLMKTHVQLSLQEAGRDGRLT